MGRAGAAGGGGGLEGSMLGLPYNIKPIFCDLLYLARIYHLCTLRASCTISSACL